MRRAFHRVRLSGSAKGSGEAEKGAPSVWGVERGRPAAGAGTPRPGWTSVCVASRSPGSRARSLPGGRSTSSRSVRPASCRWRHASHGTNAAQWLANAPCHQSTIYRSPPHHAGRPRGGEGPRRPRCGDGIAHRGYVPLLPIRWGPQRSRGGTTGLMRRAEPNRWSAVNSAATTDTPISPTWSTPPGGHRARSAAIRHH